MHILYSNFSLHGPPEKLKEHLTVHIVFWKVAANAELSLTRIQIVSNASYLVEVVLWRVLRELPTLLPRLSCLLHRQRATNTLLYTERL